MPIPFTCEHCGHYTLVADDFAGKTGPCSACGLDVTVPLINKPQRDSSKLLIVIPLLACVIFAFIIMIAAVFVVSSPLSTRTAPMAVMQQNSNTLKQIGLALHNYHSVYGTLPPAYVANEDGTRRTSWRVLVLPYTYERPLVADYNFAENWDSAANTNVRNTAVTAFLAAGLPASNPLETNFMLITGPGTAFEGDTAKPFGQFLNGTSNTAIAVQVRSMAVEWSEPRDISINELPMLLRSGVLSNERGMVRYLMADGSVQETDMQTAISQLPAMTMIGNLKPPRISGPGDPIDSATAITSAADEDSPSPLLPPMPPLETKKSP